MKNRHNTITEKVSTSFGPMYIHIELNQLAQPVGGWISSPGKEPESQISLLIENLSEGLNHALRIVREAG